MTSCSTTPIPPWPISLFSIRLDPVLLHLALLLLEAVRKAIHSAMVGLLHLDPHGLSVHPQVGFAVS